MIKDKVFKAMFDEVITISNRWLEITIKINPNIKMAKNWLGTDYRSIDLNVVVLNMRRVSCNWTSTYNIMDLGRISRTDAIDVRVLLEEYLNSSIGPHLNTTFHRKYSTRLRCGTNIGINRITYKR
jgi:hypothetical protein